MGNIHFRDIDNTNEHMVRKIKLKYEQVNFIETVDECLEEANTCDKWHPVAIYYDNEIIGFAMYGSFGSNKHTWIDRIMIDKKHQGRGFGRIAMMKLIDIVSKEYGVNTIYLSIVEENILAYNLYKSIGFKYINEKDVNGELIFQYTIMESKVKEQYKTPEKFNVRGNLHSYNINKIDWINWCFNQMDFRKNARILELGCGMGDLWYKNKHSINEEWSITLSDFSKGMLEKTKERLQHIEHNFSYEIIDAQDIPYEDESFDVVIARHMLYLVPDIEKALLEIKRVLAKGGLVYVTTNAPEAMVELNELMDGFDSEIGMSNNGMCGRFDSENGQVLLRKYFNEVKMDVLTGKIVVDKAEPIVSYKASTIKGSEILVGEKKTRINKIYRRLY